MDEHRSNDDVLLIVYDERRKKKEIDPIEIVDFDQKRANSDKVIELTMD